MRLGHGNVLFGAVFGCVVAAGAGPGAARAADPIKIGVIAETSAISGVGIPNAAKMAADEINKAGGVNGRMIEIVDYDDHSSAVDAVRAFQRAAQQDKVSAGDRQLYQRGCAGAGALGRPVAHAADHAGRLQQ